MKPITKAEVLEFCRTRYLKLLSDYGFDLNNGTAQLKIGDADRALAYGKMHCLRDVAIDGGLYWMNTRFSLKAVANYASAYTSQVTIRHPHPVDGNNIDGLVFHGRAQAYQEIVQYMRKEI